MIKSISLDSFSFKFTNHVKNFIEDHQLIHSDKKILLSVSGGLDSLCLFHVFLQLGLQFEVIHFNHGTRSASNAKEENLVLELCKRHKIKWHFFHFSFPLDQSNFEAEARKLRKETYAIFLKNNYWIYTAHHLDDSFEWTLMQSFKQSSLKSTLGIPVFNRGIVRPFMCVGKSHLKRFAHDISLQWLEDESNENTRYERNFMRLNIIKTIKEKYPQSLKHYVSRQNQLAYDFKLHRLGLKPQFSLSKDPSGGILFEAQFFIPLKDELKNSIIKFSQNKRGEIDFELTKICHAHDQLASKPGSFIKGPLMLSGGVNVYFLKHGCFILGAKEKSLFDQIDENLKNVLMDTCKTQIPEVLLVSLFPYLLIDFKKKKQFTTKFVHPLIPKTCQWLKENGISYTFSLLLDPVIRQNLTDKAFKLDSSLILP